MVEEEDDLEEVGKECEGCGIEYDPSELDSDSLCEECREDKEEEEKATE